MIVPRLEARGASKTFGSSRVLDDAHLAIQPGEIHALVGQNGSGKSTLVKILTGYHAPDPGMALALDDQPLRLPVQWSQATAAGVAVVHQDLGLLDHLSAAENIGVGGYAVRSRLTRRIDWPRQRALAEGLLARLQVPVAPDAPVGGLSAAHRAAVAIARALRAVPEGGGLLILDEATRALPRDELSRFHALLRRVVARGSAVLMVSHNLGEVLALADRVTVLRDGRVVAAGVETSGLDEQELARLMLGSHVDAGQRRHRTGTAAPGCAVEGLAAPGLAPMSFSVASGEVVGLTGLPGSGFEAIPYVLTGAHPAASGTVTTPRRHVDLTRAGVERCVRAGVALVPERRDRDGLAVDLSVQDNITVPSLRRRGRFWYVGRGWQRQQTAQAVERLGIKASAGGATLVKELSGGNQQKVLLAKWLAVDPALLVLHEPTQAVDVGARQDILRAVGAAADTGVGVLLVSVEPADLVEACDRILVRHPDGACTELRTTDPDDVLAAVYGSTAAATTPTPTTTGPGASHV